MLRQIQSLSKPKSPEPAVGPETVVYILVKGYTRGNSKPLVPIVRALEGLGRLDGMGGHDGPADGLGVVCISTREGLTNVIRALEDHRAIVAGISLSAPKGWERGHS